MTVQGSNLVLSVRHFHQDHTAWSSNGVQSAAATTRKWIKVDAEHEARHECTPSRTSNSHSTLLGASITYTQSSASPWKQAIHSKAQLTQAIHVAR
jgi:hypothetical protein